MRTAATTAVILVLAIGAGLGIDACMGSLTSRQDAANALRVQGFSNVRPMGRDIIFVQLKGCGRDDEARYTFRATNPVGKTVTVYVCIGWPFKAATVRYP